MNLNAYLQKRGRETRDQKPQVRTPWLLLGGSLAALIYIATDPGPRNEISTLMFPIVLLISFASLALTAILRLFSR